MNASQHFRFHKNPFLLPRTLCRHYLRSHCIIPSVCFPLERAFVRVPSCNDFSSFPGNRGISTRNVSEVNFSRVPSIAPSAGTRKGNSVFGQWWECLFAIRRQQRLSSDTLFFSSHAKMKFSSFYRHQDEGRVDTHKAFRRKMEMLNGDVIFFVGEQIWIKAKLEEEKYSSNFLRFSAFLFGCGKVSLHWWNLPELGWKLSCERMKDMIYWCEIILFEIREE